MAKKREHKFLNFISVVIILIFVGAIFMALGSGNLYKNTSSNQQSSSQIYRSKTLKFIISASPNWQLQEEITFVDLLSNEGKINISRIATNFSNVTDYLKDFDIKRNIVVETENKLSIYDRESVSRIEIFHGGPINKQKVYYIYVDNWVYSLSTYSEPLFGDLDQIAQSFKYTP